MKTGLVVAAVWVWGMVAVAQGAIPGFRVRPVASTAGPAQFLSSIAVDSHGTVYYTTTSGGLFRLASDGGSVLVAQVTTEAVGNSGMLGMALRGDETAIVHYTTPGPTEDVIAAIDLTTGKETILAALVCDITNPHAPAPSEHHGGNPTVAPDGTIYVGIGDYGVGILATESEWNAGKIYRIGPDGAITQYARGFRNPFDLAWDAANQRLIVPDNGVNVDDEINVITEGGDFYGWPWTFGNQPPVNGSVPPIYVFPKVVAPTGMTILSGRNPMLPHGVLLGGFVTKSVYWFPDLDARPLPEPVALTSGDTGSVIDVAEGPGGEIYVASGTAIYRLEVPQRGDCNGDGLVNAADVDTLVHELNEGSGEPAMLAPQGAVAGSWGCDVNADGIIDGFDLSQLLGNLGARMRAARVSRGGRSASGHP